MNNAKAQIELEWVKEENKHYAFFNNNQAIVFAPTYKEAKKLAALYEAAPAMLDILKNSHTYGGGAIAMQKDELINKLS